MAGALRALLVERLEVVALVALVGLTVLLPKSIPAGVYAIGVVAGASVALHVVGIILVYRANRVINFAQVAIGALGGVLFLHLVARQTFLVGISYVCPSCVRRQSVTINDVSFSVPVNPPSWLVHANYWMAMVASILVVLVVAWASHSLVIRRFTESPKLVLTLVTIGLAQMYLFLTAIVLQVFQMPLGVTAAPLPFQWHLQVAPVQFGTSDILAVLVAAVSVTGLAVFLRRSAIGVLLRGAADNPRRAQTLGANVESVTSVAWLIGAFLSVIASLLAATALGLGAQATAGTLVRILAAAVIARLVSLPLGIAAAVVIGMVDQSVLYAVSKPAVVDGILAAVVVVVLLAQRSRSTRADTDTDAGWRATRETRPIPAELKGLETVRTWSRWGPILLALVVIGLPWMLSPGQISYATSAFLYGMLAISLLVLTGWAGQISLGQFGFAAVGAYVAAWTGWPFPLAIVAGALAGAVVAVLVGLPALRLRGLHLAVTTIAFALAASSLLLDRQHLGRHLPDSVERPLFLGFDLEDQRVFYYVILVLLALAVVATIGMRRSRTARALIACRDNEALAQSYGLSLVRMRLSAFAISGCIAALAGALFTYAQFGVISETYTVDQSINIFLVAIIGGMGSIAGPLLGAAYYGVVNIFGTNQFVALAAPGFGVVILLMALPGGLNEGVFRMRDSILRRLASRHRIDVPSLVADRGAGARDRVAIAPNQRSGGGEIFVPIRYRLGGQWILDARRKAGTR